MQIKPLLFCVLVLSFFALSVDSQDAATDCEENCNDGGNCLKNPDEEKYRCFCFDGSFPDLQRFAQTNVSNCARKVTGTYKPFITFMRVFFSVLWGLLFFALCINAYMSRKYRSEENPMMRRLQTIGNTALLFLSLFQILFWATDFYGTYGTVPTWLSFVFECTLYPLVLIILSSVLGHWVEVYSSAVDSLKREEMLQKINSFYTTELSVDDVVRKVKFLKRYKWPFIFIVVFGTLIDAAYCTTRSRFNFAAGNAVTYAWTAYYTVCWFCYSFGFIIYGYRLVRLLPPEVSGRMRQLSTVITITTLSLVGLWAIALGINAPLYYTRYGMEIYVFIRAFLVNIMIVFFITLLSTVFLRIAYIKDFLMSPLSSRSSRSQKGPGFPAQEVIVNYEMEEVEELS